MFAGICSAIMFAGKLPVHFGLGELITLSGLLSHVHVSANSSAQFYLCPGVGHDSVLPLLLCVSEATLPDRPGACHLLLNLSDLCLGGQGGCRGGFVVEE